MTKIIEILFSENTLEINYEGKEPKVVLNSVRRSKSRRNNKYSSLRVMKEGSITFKQQVAEHIKRCYPNPVPVSQIAESFGVSIKAAADVACALYLRNNILDRVSKGVYCWKATQAVAK